MWKYLPRPHPDSLRRYAALTLVGSLAACQGVPGFWQARYRAPASAGVDYAAVAAGDPTFGPNETVAAGDRLPLDPNGGNMIGRVQVVSARYEDTLFDIARRAGLGYEETARANPNIDPWIPGEGTQVVLPTQYILPDAPRKGIVINLATMRLFYFPKPKPGEAQSVVTHPIGIGRTDWATPTGSTRVVSKTRNPTWTVPASIRKEHAKNGNPLPAQVPPGPDNPLGLFAMRLAIPGYLIHGTNKPDGVGMRVSHGCIRLYPEGIEALFKEVPVGTPVAIINQPILAGWRDDTLYLEAHAPLEDDNRDWTIGLTETVLNAMVADEDYHGIRIDWDKAMQVAADARGYPVPISYVANGLGGLLFSGRRTPGPAVTIAGGDFDQR